jgi:hypothetical protein
MPEEQEGVPDVSMEGEGVLIILGTPHFLDITGT